MDQETGWDFYQYSFSPLLLFTTDGYFDQGYSNYHAVAEFFKGVVSVDMLDNTVILDDRKNMRYDELYQLTITKRMVVICCIESHFTAFQVLSKDRILYYDPLQSDLMLITSEDSCQGFTLFKLLKCAYGDSQHIIEHKDFYTGSDSNALKKLIYRIWNSLNTISERSLAIKMSPIAIPLKQYCLINSVRNNQSMSTQATGNTCYFQSYLFALFCRICNPEVSGSKLSLKNEDVLQHDTLALALYLNTFFFDQNKVLRPYTNNNFLIDFMRYESSAYFRIMQSYLKANGCKQNYEYPLQYQVVLKHFEKKVIFQNFKRFQLESKMASTLNTKELQYILDTEGAVDKICSYNYFKFRPINMMFGLHCNILRRCDGFYAYNSLRKNILLSFYDQLLPILKKSSGDQTLTKYRDYYFIAQFEIGQQKLVDLHQYAYQNDLCAMSSKAPDNLKKLITEVNKLLFTKTLFSTNKMNDYEKQLKEKDVPKEWVKLFHEKFLTSGFLQQFVSMGFNQANPREKEQNALTQNVFYSSELMSRIMYRQDFEFERECINQMAKSNMTKYGRVVESQLEESNTYELVMRIGHGVTYSRYNTLLHFLNVVDNYWENADINAIQLFGKDVRTILVLVCQKIVYSDHDYFHYGATVDADHYNPPYDLLVGNENAEIIPLIQTKTANRSHQVIITDRVYSHQFLRSVLVSIFKQKKSALKTDDPIMNLALLSLMIDFDCYDKYYHLLNLGWLYSNQELMDRRELQIKVSNLISDHDQKNQDSLQKSHIQDLIFEMSYKFIVNKHFSINSTVFKIINLMNSDPQYFQYVVLCKLYMSLCQINQSVELDYYKVQCNGEQRIIIPLNYSKATGEYLARITNEYYFYEKDHYICYDGMKIFLKKDLQPDIHLYKVKLLSEKGVETMYRYIEVQNSFCTTDGDTIIFIGGNTLKIQQIAHDKDADEVQIYLNKVPVLLGTVYFNIAISFIPCFKYSDNQDVILLTSPNIYYHVDVNGQFNHHYYGMKHELIENIIIEQSFIDANDCHQFKKYKLSELITETKTVLYYPTFYLQVGGKKQIIALLDFALKIRNISFFIYLMIFLKRVLLQIEYMFKEGKVKKITGPWMAALRIAYGEVPDAHYDSIIGKQFFDINQYENAKLPLFITAICDHFAKYQKYINGKPQIVPTEKQKKFLAKIITEPESFYFSEVGSGKSKVIVPLLCQMFLSNNKETHKHLARGGPEKTILFIIVPEHLVYDAQQQAYRYCMNLNYKEEYHIYDDVFNLSHSSVKLTDNSKTIFITSFNDFKKALTFDDICYKVQRSKDRIMLLIDEVDDFLDREKLIFNICQNKNNDFQNEIVEAYYTCCTNVYYRRPPPDFTRYANPPYWAQFYTKSAQIHEEIQEKSKSINKSFGIFNEQSLKHCSTNIAQDVEGYKSLIGRPYESVNRAMPGSYYSDMERTIYLTYYILNEDIAKYSTLFQQERKFITFEYYKENIKYIDFDELIYGNTDLRSLIRDHPQIKEGITQFLFKIIVRKIEIQDKSRSVNSIDVIFNFDCKGFTGTPFIDNYPTFEYIRNKKIEKIPDLIYKDFYLHSNHKNIDEVYGSKLLQFQGDNNHVILKYVTSDWLEAITDEEKILDKLFEQKEEFNCIVDLCGVFKRLSISGVKNALKRANKPFRYIYHIDQTNGSDRILYVQSENDVQYDEEFFTRHSDLYKDRFPQMIFFFIDNRNVIGKDIPYQYIYSSQFSQPLIHTSLVIAHDVEDFSKIWQAMGRSRTMNQTKFIIQKNKLDDIEKLINKSNTLEIEINQVDFIDIQTCPISKYLYVKNCDKKVTGNLSSIYQTLISLYNLNNRKFYYENELVNIFILKMENVIQKKINTHLTKIREAVDQPFLNAILMNILQDKLKIDDDLQDVLTTQSKPLIESVIHGIVFKKYEQELKLEDETTLQILHFLSGEQQNLSELTYTKQQQKQKQQTTNKNQDNDTMALFKKDQQINMSLTSPNYFEQTMKSQKSDKQDPVKSILNTVLFSKAICSISFEIDNTPSLILIYPTYQFLYSQFILPDYITDEVHLEIIQIKKNPAYQMKAFENVQKSQSKLLPPSNEQSPLKIYIKNNFVRQNPEFTLVSLGTNIFVIGMKNQFSKFDFNTFELRQHFQYICDDQGFILHQTGPHSQNLSGTPYELPLYIVLSKLTKQELAVNVLNYYNDNRNLLQEQTLRYDRNQGEGYICWRFILNQHEKSQILQQ